MTDILDPLKRELILEWMGERSEAFTVQDLANFMGNHYQTAWRYMRALVEEGLIEKHPFRRGKADQYVRNHGMGETPKTRSQRAIRIAHAGQRVTMAEWVSNNLGDSNIAATAHALAYLLIRSYYADAPDHQHLRGRMPAVEVRAFVARAATAIREDLAVIEQLLSLRGPWQEGSELSMRWGDLPEGVTLTDIMQQAQFFENKVNPEVEVVEPDSPPVGSIDSGEVAGVSQSPAEQPGRTLTELIEEAGGDIS